MPDGLTFTGYLPPPSVPPDPSGEDWRGIPGPRGPAGTPGGVIPAIENATTPPVSDDADFTVVLLPDTQRMVAHIPDTWLAIPAWIAANKDAQNIKAVISLGDVVDDATVAGQLTVAKQGWDTIMATGIPSWIAVGNHDYDTASIGSTRPFTIFPATFPLSYLSGRSWYGGSYDGTLESYWGTFTADSATFLVLILEIFPRDAVLAWAQTIIDANPGVPTILMTHAYISKSGRRTRSNDEWGSATYGLGAPDGNDSDVVWDSFIKVNPQIFFVCSGHQIPTPCVQWLPDVSDGNTIVHQLLLNHQDDPSWGTGNIGLLRFRPSLGLIEMTDYSVGTDSLYDPGTFTMPYLHPKIASGLGVAGPIASTEPATVGKLHSLGDIEIEGAATIAGQSYFGTLPTDTTARRAVLEANDVDSTQIMHLRLGLRFSHIGLGNYHITNNARYHASGYLHDQNALATKFSLNSDGSFDFSYTGSGAAGSAISAWVDRVTITAGGMLQIAPAAAANGGDYLSMAAGRFHMLGVTGLNITNNASYDGSQFRYVQTTAAQKLALNADGSLQFDNAPSGTAGNVPTFTTRFKIGAAGEVLTTPLTPASAGATGTAGQIAADADYLYVCTATNTWKRVAVATW